MLESELEGDHIFRLVPVLDGLEELRLARAIFRDWDIRPLNLKPAADSLAFHLAINLWVALLVVLVTEDLDPVAGPGPFVHGKVSRLGSLLYLRYSHPAVSGRGLTPDAPFRQG